MVLVEMNLSVQAQARVWLFHEAFAEPSPSVPSALPRSTAERELEPCQGYSLSRLQTQFLASF